MIRIPEFLTNRIFTTGSPSIFGDVTWLDDQTIGVIITVIAVVFVVSCLLMNVKILKSIVQGGLSNSISFIECLLNNTQLYISLLLL